ncbi:DUF3954 domain-containing protein [Bacillus sp. IITD106]|nr:DUF3954 domain-containing protein [Bacillus sp. IITD106]
MTDEKTKAVIDLLEDAVYIVKNGQKTKVSPKDFGQDIIFWKNGQVLDIDRNERIRVEGQEVI